MILSIWESTFSVVEVFVWKKEYVCMDIRIAIMMALITETINDEEQESLLKPPIDVFV